MRFLLILTLLFPTMGYGQQFPVLVKDINTQNRQASELKYLGTLDEFDYLLAIDTHTYAVLKTKGSSNNTEVIYTQTSDGPIETVGSLVLLDRLLFEVEGSLYKIQSNKVTILKRFSRRTAGYLDKAVLFKKRIFFSVNTGKFGKELWQSNGNAKGTVIVKDIVKGKGSSSPILVGHTDDFLLFTTKNSDTSGIKRDLWVTDGSRTGTKTLVKKIKSGPGISFGNELYFKAAVPKVSGGLSYALWKSNGTTTGTSPIKDFAFRGKADVFLKSSYFVTDDKFYFTASTTKTGEELWSSDGMASNTELIRDINPGTASSSVSDFYLKKDILYFSADDGKHGRELWSSDGSPTGTDLVEDIIVGSSSNPQGITGFDNLLLFTVEDDKGNKSLRVYDTFNKRVSRLSSMGAVNAQSQILANKLLYYVDPSGDLWKSNGRPGGTIRLREGVGDPDTGATFFLLNNKSYVITELQGEKNLFKTDGTPQGTRRAFENFGLGTASAAPADAAVGYSDMFFTAFTPQKGRELWKSDGTPEGTFLLKDIIHGPDSSYPTHLFANGSKLYFSTKNAPVKGQELWSSDGSPEGTILLKDIYKGTESSSPSDFVLLNGRVYFSAFGIRKGRELWSTEGDRVSTRLFKDIHREQLSSSPASLVSLNDNIVFAAEDEKAGRELWVSDGLKKNTRLLKPIVPGVASTDPEQLTKAGNRMFFTAWHPSYGRELWRSNGTPQGTRLVKKIGKGLRSSEIQAMYPSGNNIYFVRTELNGQLSLWYSDGTRDNTRLLKKFYDEVHCAAALDGKLYFSAKQSIGAKSTLQGLWVTDGTRKGTVVITEDLYPEAYIVHAGILYFLEQGRLGRSDGSFFGTRILSDKSTYLRSAKIMGILRNELLFSAISNKEGNEIWKFRLPNAPEGDKWDFYPNPVEKGNEISVEIHPPYEHLKLVFTDMSGDAIRSLDIKDRQFFRLKMSGISIGMYTITPYADNVNLGSKKVMIR